MTKVSHPGGGGGGVGEGNRGRALDEGKSPRGLPTNDNILETGVPIWPLSAPGLVGQAGNRGRALMMRV